MKYCSPFTMLKRNHLPIVSILGCISCLYILSQKDTLNDEAGNIVNLINRGNFGGGGPIERPVEAPLVVDHNARAPVVEQRVQKRDPTGVGAQQVPQAGAIAAPRPPAAQQAPAAVAGGAAERGPVQAPAAAAGGAVAGQGEPVISYDDPERVKFPGYEHCAKVDFQPEHAMPLVALATYMSSGDVIVRQRLQAATGIYTGTWNEAEAGYPRSKSGVFLGSTVDYKLGRTVVAKTQIAQPDHIVTFEGGAVLVIRNPHTMIIAEYIRRKQEADRAKKFSPEDIAGWFQLPDWKTFFETEVGNWRSFAIQWITYAKKLIIVSYESFFDNPVPETSRIIVFLGVQQDNARISCSIQAYPRDHLNKAINFDPYTDEMKAKIGTFVKEVNQTIVTRGLRPLPTWTNTF